MEIVNIRNRYKYETEWGSATTVLFELRFWYPGDTKPTNPTYTIQRIKYANEIVPYFDLSKFAKDYTLKEPYKPTDFDTGLDGGYPMVNVEVITKKDGVVNNTETFQCLYGYEENVIASPLYLLHPSNVPVRVEDAGSFGVLFETGSFTINYYDIAGSLIGSTTQNVSTISVYNISLSFNSVLAHRVEITTGGLPHATVQVDNPLRCNKTGKLTFRNSFGGLEYMDVYGEIVKSVNTERNRFEYKENIRGRASDNRENHYTYTINTGWIPEKYNLLVESLFISPLVYINNDRILIEGTSVELKTNRKDGLFQYTFQGTNSINFADY
jgi:hypothetical protein